MDSFKKLGVRVCLAIMAIFLSVGALPKDAGAQGLELSGGWAHITQDFGTDGFQLGAAWRFDERVGIAANYDDAWDISRIGAFEFTNVGAIASKSHLQNFLVGPRFYFAPQTVSKHRIDPFGEVQFGISHLNSKIQEGIQPAVQNSDDGFSWLLGAGADYRLASHWSARANVGLLRTHLNDAGQSRLRVVLGVSYSFGGRNP